MRVGEKIRFTPRRHDLTGDTLGAQTVRAVCTYVHPRGIWALVEWEAPKGERLRDTIRTPEDDYRQILHKPIFR